MQVMEVLENLTLSLDLADPVNDSLKRAEEIASTAHNLETLYEDTRGVSENAVRAGKAYEMILADITAAEKMSQQAVNDTVIMNESLKVGNDVVSSMNSSQVLLDNAHMIYNLSQTDSMERKRESDMAINKAKENNMAVKTPLEKRTSEFNKLKKERTDSESARLLEKTSEIQDQVNKTMEMIKPVNTEITDIEKKMNYIMTNTPKIREDIVESKRKAEVSSETMPKVKEHLSRLTVNAEILTNKTRQLVQDVTDLREKIARARDEANSIRVGLKFHGNTTVTLRNPANLEDSGSLSELSVFFKTNQTDALLVYIGKNHNTGAESLTDFGRVKRQTTEFRSDYLALELRGGRPVFTFNLGSGAASIQSNRLVNDGHWHQIYAKRIGKTGTLIVKSQNGTDDVTEGVSPGTNSVLEYNKLFTLFLAGGVPDDVTLPDEVTYQSFVGSMEELTFDRLPVGLWNFVSGRNNNEGEIQRNFKQEDFKDGMRFNGQGYAVLNKTHLRLTPDENKLSFEFKTYAEEGVMFYMGKDDYFSVELRRGKIVFQYDLGSGSAILQSTRRYNDGKWHKIFIHRQKKKGLLRIDDSKTEKEILKESRGKLSNLETTQDIYFGGIETNVETNVNVMTRGFDGCIKNIIVSARPIELSNKNLIKRSKGLIKGCPVKEIYQVSFPSSKLGYIGLKPVNIGSMFDVTFKFKTSAQNALLMVASDKSQSNVFTVSLKNGQAVVSEQFGNESSFIPSESNAYGNSKWHYISLMKMGQKLTMSIDDSDMFDGNGKAFELLTDQPVYFGGLPSGFDVKSDILANQEGLDGCIGDITINKEFKNLALNGDLIEKNRVLLDECYVKTAEEEDKPKFIEFIESPNKCMLAPVASFDTIDETDTEDMGHRFGAHPYSRQEYLRLPIDIKRRAVVIKLKFKTTAENGVLFYSSDSRHNDFISIYMLKGKVKYGFNCGSGAADLESLRTYNDGQWHTVSVMRRQRTGYLKVDSDGVNGESKGQTTVLNLRNPHYVGGLKNAAIQKRAYKNLKQGVASFVGCIKDITFKKRSKEIALDPAKRESFYVKSCSSNTEHGTFFGLNGGNIIWNENNKVGTNFLISMDIKPRTQEGVLMAVHSSGKLSDFAVLQMSQGAIIFTVENGAGPITIRYTPETQNTLCDGKWHTILAKKVRNELMLSVDGISTEPVIGAPSVSSADTDGPMYFGGVDKKTSKGIEAKAEFKGCMKNILINGKNMYLSTLTNVNGDVNVGGCPVN